MSRRQYYANLSSDGSFSLPSDQVLYLEPPFQLTLILNSKKIFDFKPLLVTNLNQPRFHYNEVLYGDKQPTYPFQQPQEGILEGVFREEGSWQCDLECDYSQGSRFFRLLWVNKKKVSAMGEPLFAVIENHKTLTLQSTFPLSLGNTLQEWQESINSLNGINAIHLLPVSKLGKCGSYYALQEQCEVNPNLREVSWTELKNFTSKIGKTIIIDVVLNHTANDSPWLTQPQYQNAIYTERTAPMLKTAIMWDQKAQEFSDLVQEGKQGKYNIQLSRAYEKGNIIQSLEDIDYLLDIFSRQYIEPLKLEEYFSMNVELITNNFLSSLDLKNGIIEKEEDLDEEENIFVKSPFQILKEMIENEIYDLGIERYGVKFGIESIVDYYKNHTKKVAIESFKRAIEKVNESLKVKAVNYLKEAIDNSRKWLINMRLNQRNQQVNSAFRFLPNYFSKLANGVYAANNGFIENHNVEKNFAESSDFHYLRRSIYPWVNIVKLRYGASKRECPALWERMKQYVILMSQTFHGIRIDNASSTPLPVGEYLMKKARMVNKNLIVIAELFDASKEQEALFVSRLGVNMLIRETINCIDSKSLSQTINYHSGNGKDIIGKLPQCYEILDGKKYELLQGRIPYAILFEQSHDNQLVYHKFGFEHQLPLMCLLTFSTCSVGTVRGFDEYFTEFISVLNEKRIYSKKSFEPPQFIPGQHQPGQRVKCKLVYHLKEKEDVEQLRQEDQSLLLKRFQCLGSFTNWNYRHPMYLSEDGLEAYAILELEPNVYEYKFTENNDWKCCICGSCLVNKNTNHDLIIENLLDEEHVFNLTYIRSILSKIEFQNYPTIQVKDLGNGVIMIIRERKDQQEQKIVIARGKFKSNSSPCPIQIELSGQIKSIDFVFQNSGESEEAIFQPEFEFLRAKHKVKINKNLQAQIIETQNSIQLHYTNLPESYVAILTTIHKQEQKEAIIKLEQQLNSLQKLPYEHLSAQDINYLLFTCEIEHLEDNRDGMYNIPNYGQLAYAGLYGPLWLIQQAQKKDGMKNPLCQNLIEGNWLIQYMVDRMKLQPNEIFDFVVNTLELLKKLPRHLVPHYFARLIDKFIREIQWALTKFRFPFYRDLKMALFQFQRATVSVGLKNYASSPLRQWGRETFIAFRGLYLIQGDFVMAKKTLLFYASYLRHGLLPNFLDNGRNPRYNNRDVCWWFIKAIRDYLEFTEDYQIFNIEVEMKYLDDDIIQHHSKLDQGQKLVMKFSQIIHSIFQMHAQGIRFREWNAGIYIDQNMETFGFNIELKLDQETGFIVGGNYSNALTWMDKIGASSQAGNKGLPATSRDGAPIETTALLKCALDFVHRMYQQNHYPFDGVKLANNQKLTFRQWSEFINVHFEKCYWVPLETNRFQEYSIQERHLRRKGIYRDIYKSSKPRNEYQLRSNACIAMAVAPDLFVKQHKLHHLAIVESLLIEDKSIGIKSLDRIASEYYHIYDITFQKKDDSSNFKTGLGFSLHNGPEWVWSYGYYLKALVKLHGADCPKEVFFAYLSNHKNYISNNEWYSLPELTDQNGQFNTFCCSASLTSVALINEAIFDFLKAHKMSY